MEISLFFPSAGLRSKVEPSKTPLHTSQGQFFLWKIHSTPPKPPTLQATLFLTDTHRLSSLLSPHILWTHITSLPSGCAHEWQRPDVLCGFLSRLFFLPARLRLLLHTHLVTTARFRGQQRFSLAAKRFTHRAFHLRKLNPLVKYEEGPMSLPPAATWDELSCTQQQHHVSWTEPNKLTELNSSASGTPMGETPGSDLVSSHTQLPTHLLPENDTW